MWLMSIAQALLLPNWVAGFSGIIAFDVLYFLCVPREEDMMLREVGEYYQRYMSQTGRVAPKRGLTSELTVIAAPS